MHESFDDPDGSRFGGMIQFFRGPGIKYWTPTGLNVPDYAKLAPLWWQNIGEAVAGEVTPETALNNLAKAQDQMMERIGRSGLQGDCGPKLNPEVDEDPQWLVRPAGIAEGLRSPTRSRKARRCDYDKIMQLEAWTGHFRSNLGLLNHTRSDVERVGRFTGPPVFS